MRSTHFSETMRRPLSLWMGAYHLHLAGTDVYLVVLLVVVVVVAVACVTPPRRRCQSSSIGGRPLSDLRVFRSSS